MGFAEKWYVKGAGNADIMQLSSQCGISPLIAKILCNRGVDSKKEIDNFIHGDILKMHSPSLMKDMREGVAILADAIHKKEKILIVGDYDVDGITSVCILAKVLEDCGGDWTYKIPHRVDDGYGININIINDAVLQGVKVILTCDNGISAIEQIGAAVSNGIKVVVTDHHEPREFLPSAHAVIDNKRKDSTYPFDGLCGAGVAYKLAVELYAAVGIDEYDDNYLIELLTVATVCDIVDLVDENRYFVKEGLRLLNAPSNVGLRALNRIVGMEGKKHTVYSVGFTLGPCINATGRLEHADIAVKLLTEKNYDEALKKAEALAQLNGERKLLTEEAFNAALAAVTKMYGAVDSATIPCSVLVVFSEDIKESVAGIVAGRLKEKFGVPTVVLCPGSEGVKGSARSIKEINIFGLICKCEDILDKFGGHAMAAGMSLQRNNIDKLRERLNAPDPAISDICRKVSIDAVMPIVKADLAIAKQLDILEPYGKGNEKPVFADKNLLVKSVRMLGKAGRAAELMLENEQGSIKKTLMFGNPSDLNKFAQDSRDKKIDVCYNLGINEYNGRESESIVITHFRYVD